MEGEEGSQQLILADNEVVKRKKNMGEEEEEVVKRMKIMEGEEGSQQPQLVLADKDDHLIRLLKTLNAEAEQEAIEFQSWLAEYREERKKHDEKVLGRVLGQPLSAHMKKLLWGPDLL